MSSTIAELTLSPAYRLAQRAVAAWLERGHANARQTAFAARAALGGLDATEKGRLARWLAWLTVAARSRGALSPIGRIQRLDASLHRVVEDALRRLPADALVAPTRIQRQSA